MIELPMIRATCLTACLGLSVCSAPPARTVAGEETVYVIGRGWHTDIGLPVSGIEGSLTVMQQPFPGARFLTFGFGERQFLLARRPSPLTLISAMLPSRSALLMTVLQANPAEAFGDSHVIALHVTRDGLQRIEAQVWRELQKSPSGEPIRLADGPYPGSVFYAAVDTYDGLFTCNTWTAETMHAGGLPTPTAGVLFASQVMGMARWISGLQSMKPD